MFEICLRRFLIATSVWMCLPAWQVSHADEFAGQRWAVLIGVDDYAQATDLNYCGADMVALRDQLVVVGFPEKQIKLLHDGAKENRFRPFKGNIERQLDIVLGLADRGDMLVVALSGHGIHFGGTSYFCPAEAELDDPSTLVSLDRVYDQLKRSKAALKLVIVDACRNDPRVPGQKSLSKPAKAFATALRKPLPEGLILLSSCAPGETSFEEPKYKHGVFMYHLLEGLKGKADSDGNKRVSIKELAGYATNKTKVYVADRFNDSQRPYLKGELTLEAFDFEFPRLGATEKLLITNSIGMKLRLILAGDFQMGTTKSAAQLASLFETKADYFADELPRHRVRITANFRLGVTEVTQSQWRSVMGTQPWSEKKIVKEGADYPATNVSWDEAVEFCRKLSAKEGVTYRLPTEAEWEYACRAGSTSMYSFGDSLGSLKDYAWFDENALDIDEKHAHQVSRKRPNALGLYDMHGNVWEWCSDRYGSDYYKSSPAADPRGPSSGSGRVLRGGGWGSSSDRCRSAHRLRLTPDIRLIDLGFRVLRSSIK